MDLELVEPHPRRVLEAFRQGDFDGLEILGQADEKAFFELCFREKLLEAVADFDDHLLERFLHDQPIDPKDVIAAVRKATSVDSWS